MTFPTINFKFNELEEAKALSDIVEQKFLALEKYIAGAGTCDVEFIKVAQQQSGQVHRVEVTLAIGGDVYRAEAVEDSFEKAIDEVRDELDKELRRAKDKQLTVDKQAGREAKEQMLDAEV